MKCLKLNAELTLYLHAPIPKGMHNKSAQGTRIQAVILESWKRKVLIFNFRFIFFNVLTESEKFVSHYNVLIAPWRFTKLKWQSTCTMYISQAQYGMQPVTYKHTYSSYITPQEQYGLGLLSAFLSGGSMWVNEGRRGPIQKSFYNLYVKIPNLGIYFTEKPIDFPWDGT